MSLRSFFGLAGKTAEDSAPFDAACGMALLQEKKFDESAAYFARHLPGNPLAYYGLAQTKFRRDVAHLSVEKMREIIGLLEQAIALSPGFADAHFMGGMACNAAAGFQLGPYNKDRALLVAGACREPDHFLAEARQFLGRAGALDPGFSSIIAGEMTLNEKLQALSDRLKGEL